MKLNNSLFWASQTGMLPIHLNPLEKENKYILLDGGVYDFCLDLSGVSESFELYKSLAWSSNSKNYICVNDNDVIVYNWLKETEDKLPKSIVENKFAQFVKILNDSSYNTSYDVVPFVLDLFRSLRNQTAEKKEPLEALNLLYRLLVSLEEQKFDEVICEKWKIADVATNSIFDDLVEKIRKGSRNITPNLDLILRHSSGLIFQEAHRFAQSFSNQLTLFGGFSSEIKYGKDDSYSSIHYTPQYLARSIVEKCLDGIDMHSAHFKILDPACGSGSFLIEVLKQLKERGFTGNVTICGWDSSACAISTTNFLLSYEKRTQWESGVLNINLKQVNDSLTENWEDDYDLILMNPPFMSMELIKTKEGKDAVNVALEDLGMRKRPNQSAAFLYKAVKALKANGILGVVLPSSILLADQYDILRNRIREQAELVSVGRLGNYIFENALTDVSFLTLRKMGDNYKVPQTIWCKNIENAAYEAIKDWRKMKYANSSSCIQQNYNIYIPNEFPQVRSTWKTIPINDDKFVSLLHERVEIGQLKPLSSMFDIKQGLIRGNKDSFVATSNELEMFSSKERMFFRRLANGDTIHDGHIDNSLFIWFPYDQNGLIIKTEEQLQKYSNIFNWLSVNKNNLSSRKGVSAWWELTRPRVWQYQENHLLISKRFGNSSSFAITCNNEVIEEGNAFIFKSKSEDEDIYFYLALLSSSIFERLLSIFAKPILSGYDLGKASIKDIPVPDVFNNGLKDTEAYRQLCSCGRQYAQGNEFVLDKINQIVKLFYPQI